MTRVLSKCLRPRYTKINTWTVQKSGLGVFRFKPKRINIFQSYSHLHIVEMNRHFAYDFIIIIPKSVFSGIRTDFEIKDLHSESQTTLPHQYDLFLSKRC